MSNLISFSDIISTFGASAKSKLSNIAVDGAPEDQLRAPLEHLTAELAKLCGFADGAVVMVGESSLAELKTRPDYAVSVKNALVGFVEVKAPGKGSDPRYFVDKHDKEQWQKLKSLPNVLYTDGNGFSLWRNGVLEGSVIRLEGNIETSGGTLEAPAALQWLFEAFLGWQPIPPLSARELAKVSARLCRLLRDEVTEQLEQENDALTHLAADWRKLLFPTASDAEFADGYAQAVTFGLLMARARKIGLSNGIDQVAKELRKSNSLIGTALRLLTDHAENQDALKTSLATLARVLDSVDWSKISKGDSEAWLYFYEEFLGGYDNTLRKKTGSYYTPPEVVRSMVRLVDEALRSPDRFARPSGLASGDVTIADPAVGTGTFLLAVFRQIADTIEVSQGAGAVSGAITAAVNRLIGFELQFGPFAVAHLRLLAELVDLVCAAAHPALRLHITDTLGNPFVEQEWLPSIYEPISKSRQAADTIKRQEPITVVIGNPPYKEKAKGRGGWIESGSPTMRAPLLDWMPPVGWGVGAHAKHLRNLYVYFWRWATWKVFGPTVPPNDGVAEEKAGIVCFITVAGFLNGDGFLKMRDDLRRTADEIWVIDCSPEGHQPNVPTRIFQGVQQPVCIVLVARTTATDPAKPARVRFRALPLGTRAEKFAALQTIGLDNAGWVDCSDDWRGPFLPAAVGAWATYPALDDLFIDNGAGVMPGRTWVIAPDAGSLIKRWNVLVKEKDTDKKAALFHPHLRGGKPGDKHVNKTAEVGLTGHEHRKIPVSADKGAPVKPMPYAFRSFDRQWIIPDSRLINQPNPSLWNGHSKKQVYLTALDHPAATSGPAVTLTSLIPDLHHFKGSFGGRVYRLYADSAGTLCEVSPAIIKLLSDTYGRAIVGDEVMAYIAAIAACPAYTERFRGDLVSPPLRIPFPVDAKLFVNAVAVGREVIWVQAFGERFTDPVAGRPASRPRLPREEEPTIPAGGAIPGDAASMPNEMEYDKTARRLRIGKGYVDNVPPDVWAYEVGGKQILRQWFSYRKLDRSRPIMGDRRPPSALGNLQPNGWLSEYTTDLIDVLHVLGRLVALAPKQADLLKRICEGPTIADFKLQAEIAAPPQPVLKKSRKSKSIDPNQPDMV